MFNLFQNVYNFTVTPLETMIKRLNYTVLNCNSSFSYLFFTAAKYCNTKGSQLMLIKNENDVKALKQVSKQIKTDQKKRVFLGLRNYVHKSLDCLEWTDQCDGLLWDNGEEFNSTIFKPGMYHLQHIIIPFSCC